MHFAREKKKRGRIEARGNWLSLSSRSCIDIQRRAMGAYGRCFRSSGRKTWRARISPICGDGTKKSTAAKVNWSVCLISQRYICMRACDVGCPRDECLNVHAWLSAKAKRWLCQINFKDYTFLVLYYCYCWTWNAINSFLYTFTIKLWDIAVYFY